MNLEECKEDIQNSRMQWKLMVANVELQKKLHPETSEALDAYLESLKTILKEYINETFLDEENQEEFNRVMAYVFGESEELILNA